MPPVCCKFLESSELRSITRRVAPLLLAFSSFGCSAPPKPAEISYPFTFRTNASKEFKVQNAGLFIQVEKPPPLKTSPSIKEPDEFDIRFWTTSIHSKEDMVNQNDALLYICEKPFLCAGVFGNDDIEVYALFEEKNLSHISEYVPVMLEYAISQTDEYISFENRDR